MSLRSRSGGGPAASAVAGAGPAGGPIRGGGPRLSTGSNFAGRNSGNTPSGAPKNHSNPPNRWASPSSAGTHLNGTRPQHAPNSSPAAASGFPSLRGAKAQGNATPSQSQSDPVAVVDGASAVDMKDRTLFVVVSLIGNTVVATTKTGQRWLGILHSTTSTTTPGQHNDLGVTLSTAQELNGDGTLGSTVPLFVINGQDLELVEASDIVLGQPIDDTVAPPIPSGFRTDIQISVTDKVGEGEGRSLQRWDEGGSAMAGIEDSVSSAASARSSAAWDQFAANEARFGLKSNYDENLYTTKLDRSVHDFKEKEKRAERIAAEILGQATTNTHIAEERGQIDESDQNEEEKYGAVKRGPNAYIPPAARKAAAAPNVNANGKKAAPVPTPAAGQTQSAVSPKVLLAEAAEKKANLATPSIAVNTASPTCTDGEPTVPSPSTQRASAANNEKLKSDFKQFVSSERQRIESLAKAQAEREKRSKLAELRDWSSNFKLKTPMPDDVAFLAHRAATGDRFCDPSRQKSSSPVTSHTQAAPALSFGAGSVSSVHPNPSGGAEGTTADATATTTTNTTTNTSPSSVASTAASDRTTAGKATSEIEALKKPAESKAPLSKMTIPKIPPFNPDKAKSGQQAMAGTAAGVTMSSRLSSSAAPLTSVSGSKITAACSNFRMSAKASTFRPFNPAAASFAPGASVCSATSHNAPAPAPASSVSTAPPNPFFETKVFKKPTTPLHVREDFNPFKTGKVPESSSVTPTWPYNGKSFRVIYSQHLAPTQTPIAPANAPNGQGPSGMQHHHPAHQPYSHQGIRGMPSSPSGFEATGFAGQGEVGMPATLPPTPASSHSHPSSQHHSQSSLGTAPATPIQGGAGALPHGGHPGHPGGPPPHAGPVGPMVQPQPGQPFGMVYQPPGPYRFPPHGQYMVQSMPLGSHGGPATHMPYGAGGPGGLPPHQFAMMPGQPQGMPFSPPMGHQGAAGPGMYSPQLAPATISGLGGQYISVGGPSVVGPRPAANGQIMPVSGPPRSGGGKGQHLGGPGGTMGVGSTGGHPPHHQGQLYYGGHHPPQLGSGASPAGSGPMQMGSGPPTTNTRATGGGPGSQQPPLHPYHGHNHQSQYYAGQKQSHAQGQGKQDPASAPPVGEPQRLSTPPAPAAGGGGEAAGPPAASKTKD